MEGGSRLEPQTDDGHARRSGLELRLPIRTRNPQGAVEPEQIGAAIRDDGRCTGASVRNRMKPDACEMLP